MNFKYLFNNVEILLDHSERQILNLLNLNINTKNCYYPKDMSDDLGTYNDKLNDELKVAKICLRLLAKGVIDLKEDTPSDPNKLRNCYGINAKGIDELNPSSMNKNLYKIAIIGAICAPITIVLTIIVIYLTVTR